MIGVKIDMQIGSIKNFNKQLSELPFDLADEFATEIGKSARIRAKEWTGQMKAMVQVETGKKKIKKIQNLAPYAIYQERGFTPHFVSLGAKTGGGLTVKDWLKEHQDDKPSPMKGHGKRGYIWVGGRGQGQSYKPFMIPAVESVMNRFPQIAERIAKRRIEQGLRALTG